MTGGPVGEATFSRALEMLMYVRRMGRKFISREPDSTGEIAGQRVDNIATVVQPVVYTLNGRLQLARRKYSQKTLKLCLSANTESPRFKFHGLPRPELFNNRITTLAVR